jgi:hypothetical protein
MKKIFFLMLAFLIWSAASVNAQVRIGGIDDPNPSAVLDLNATDATEDGTLGLALPRVELTSTISYEPLRNHVAGMIVYNTKTIGDVTPGTYYNDGEKWIRIGNGSQIVEADGVIGNEVTNATTGGGLVRAGEGTATAPWTLGIATDGVTNARLANSSVNSAKIEDLSIVAADLADKTVSGDKIADATIDSTKLVAATVGVTRLKDNSVNSAKIMNGAVTLDDLAVNSVNSDKIEDLSIVAADLANKTVTGAKIADATIDSTKIVAATVGVTRLKDNSVNSAKIIDGSIVAADLADKTVTGAKIADVTIDSTKLVAATVGVTRLKDNSVNSAKIINGSIATADLADGAITAAKLHKMGADTDYALVWNGSAWAPKDIAANNVVLSFVTVKPGAITVPAKSSVTVSWTIPDGFQFYQCISTNSHTPSGLMSHVVAGGVISVYNASDVDVAATSASFAIRVTCLRNN